MELYAILLTAEERDTLARLADWSIGVTQSANKEAEAAHKALLTGLRDKAKDANREETHNGWANYETFHVRNWLGGDYGAPQVYAQARETAREAADAASRDFGPHKVAGGEPLEAWKARRESFQERQAGEALKVYVREEFGELNTVTANPLQGFTGDALNAFLARVDWRCLGAWALEN